jgi:hypothetical protein
MQAVLGDRDDRLNGIGFRGALRHYHHVAAGVGNAHGRSILRGQVDAPAFAYWELIMNADLRDTLLERVSFYKQSIPPEMRTAIQVWGLRIPLKWRKRINQTAELFAVSFEDALLLNLDYEFWGVACTTAAVPVGTDSYTMVRALDWDIPPALAKTIEWTYLNDRARHRELRGYVGTLTGHRLGPEPFGIALNVSHDTKENVDFGGLPISWVIRDVLETAADPYEAVDMLERRRYLVGGYVIVVGKHEAYWIRAGLNTHVHKTVLFPDLLIVRNSLEPDTAETEKALDIWQEDTRKEVGAPIRNGGTADLVVVDL